MHLRCYRLVFLFGLLIATSLSHEVLPWVWIIERCDARLDYLLMCFSGETPRLM
jgi:hypothetical protein